MMQLFGLDCEKHSESDIFKILQHYCISLLKNSGFILVSSVHAKFNIQ